jgi:hypothetical protein
MSPRSFRSLVACSLAAACCVLTLASCGRSPSAPLGRLQVYVSQDWDRPAPGKRIEIPGTLLSKTTDENGLATFILRPGSYVVRAYEIGTGGPGFLYVEQGVEVAPGLTAHARFNDCTMCASPSQ